MKTPRKWAKAAKILNCELIDFSRELADKFDKLSIGEYFSNNKKYQVSFVRCIKYTDGTHAPALFRVSPKSGRVELDKKILFTKPHTKDIVFFGLIWSAIKCELKHEPHDYEYADITAITCSVQQGYSALNIFNSMRSIFKNSSCEINRNRIFKMQKYMDENKDLIQILSLVLKHQPK